MTLEITDDRSVGDVLNDVLNNDCCRCWQSTILNTTYRYLLLIYTDCRTDHPTRSKRGRQCIYVMVHLNSS